MRCRCFNGYYMHIGELGYSWLAGEEKMPGRIGIGGWYADRGGIHARTHHRRKWQRAIIFLPLSASGTSIRASTTPASSATFSSPTPAPKTRQVNTYIGAGLSGVRLIPGRPTDQVSVGIAYSWLNDTPGAGAFFYPNVASASNDLRNTEFMFQTVYQTNFYFKVGGGFFGLHPQFGYTYIPNPGQRPDLPAAHVFSLRLITLF